VTGLAAEGRGGSGGPVSLARALSKLGAASRREAVDLIAAGRVTVDGEVVTDPAHRLDLGRARLALDGRALAAQPRVTLLLHKPRGVMTTRWDPEGRRTVFDLVGELADAPSRLVAVGRLDLASSGLLLLTSDTRLADALTDPRNEVVRVYLVTVRGDVDDATAERMRRGVLAEGELLQPRRLTVRKRSRRESHLTLELAQGRNREVRRLCAAVGRPVTRLRRVAFGGLELGDLVPGEWREVSDEELRAAFPEVRLTD
jgi:23S rRNA pseudouridine2605 synthase